MIPIPRSLSRSGPVNSKEENQDLGHHVTCDTVSEIFYGCLRRSTESKLNASVDVVV